MVMIPNVFFCKDCMYCEDICDQESECRNPNTSLYIDFVLGSHVRSKCQNARTDTELCDSQARYFVPRKDARCDQCASSEYDQDQCISICAKFAFRPCEDTRKVECANGKYFLYDARR